jgi:hypothetical protein
MCRVYSKNNNNNNNNKEKKKKKKKKRIRGEMDKLYFLTLLLAIRIT